MSMHAHGVCAHARPRVRCPLQGHGVQIALLLHGHTSRAQGRSVGRSADGADPQSVLHTHRLIVEACKPVLGQRPARQRRELYCVMLRSRRHLAPACASCCRRGRAHVARFAHRSTAVARDGRRVPLAAPTRACAPLSSSCISAFDGLPRVGRSWAFERGR